MKNPFSVCREPVSSMTHFWGAVVSAAGCIFLLARGLFRGVGAPALGGALVFGLSLICLYAASSVYHFSLGSRRRVALLRRVDHSMIYLLIAGSYTPFCLACLPAAVCRPFLIVLWALALAGIVLKNCWMNMPRVLGTSLYLALGWAAVAQWKYFLTLPTGCFSLVLLGGLLYSAGAVIYMLKKPVISPRWGSHELFHLFILAGSAAHFAAVCLYLL